MSQRSKNQKRGGREGGGSQPSTSRQQDVEDINTGDAIQSSQAGSSMARKAYEKMDPQLCDRKVSEVVRYLLCAEGRKVPVKRKELTDKVMGEHSRAFPVVLERANEKLMKVFGLEAKEIIRGKTKSIVLINTLPPETRELGLIKRSDHDRAHFGLLSIVLSLILMRQGKITEDQLWHCLGRLGLSQDGMKHHVFGDADKLISKELVDQMYLDRERQVAGDGYAVWYRWGPRANEEVDKTKLLGFVAEMYGGNYAAWERHFRDSLLSDDGPVQSTQD